MTKQSTRKISVAPAPFWRRFTAWGYDLLGGLAVLILALVIGFLIVYLVTLPWSRSAEVLAIQLNRNPLWTIYLITAVQYYYCWCWVKGGQTIGMKAWRLQLCKPGGQRLSWKEAYYRSFLSLGGIANLWSIIDSEKRGWHDIACNSCVVVLPKNYPKHNQPESH